MVRRAWGYFGDLFPLLGDPAEVRVELRGCLLMRISNFSDGRVVAYLIKSTITPPCSFPHLSRLP